MYTQILQLIPQTSAFVRRSACHRVRIGQSCTGLWPLSIQARYQLDRIPQPVDDIYGSIGLPTMSIGILTDDASLFIL